jgi:hypothetical protein
MSKLSRIIVCAATLSSGVAAAEPQSFTPIDPRTRAQLFNPGGPSGSKGAVDRPSSIRVEGRVIRSTHGDLLLERELEPSRINDLQKMGFRLVDSIAKVGDRTIMGNNVYISYAIKRSEWAHIKPGQLDGKQVTLDVEHDARGFPMVVSIKTKS